MQKTNGKSQKMNAQDNVDSVSILTASADIEFTDIRIDVPWGILAGRWYGNQKIRPLLALHGWLDNIGTWEKLIPLLPQYIGVLCIDLPGHGHSSKYPPGMIYHVVDFTQVIVYVMKQYNWQKVSLLGHSLGAIVGFIYASLNPHSVDMIISIDIIHSTSRNAEKIVETIRQHIEKNIFLDERQNNFNQSSYTYDELTYKVFNGTDRSLNLENCKYILNRNIQRTTKYPEKYYFLHDTKLKYYIKFSETQETIYEMIKKIVNIPYLVIKGIQSSTIQIHKHKEFFEIMQKNNSSFEFHQIDGTHHLHINNANKVAAIVNPFIIRYRADTSILDNLTSNENENNFTKLEKIMQVKGNQKELRKSKL